MIYLPNKGIRVSAFLVQKLASKKKNRYTPLNNKNLCILNIFFLKDTSSI